MAEMVTSQSCHSRALPLLHQRLTPERPCPLPDFHARAAAARPLPAALKCTIVSQRPASLPASREIGAALPRGRERLRRYLSRYVSKPLGPGRHLPAPGCGRPAGWSVSRQPVIHATHTNCVCLCRHPAACGTSHGDQWPLSFCRRPAACAYIDATVNSVAHG
jgi:hypothetical protein